MFTRFRNTLYALLLAGLTISACQSRAGTAVTPSVSLLPTIVPTATATITPIPSLSPTPEATVLDTITPVPTLPPIPETVWTYSTGGAIWGTPTISNGVVYFGSDDGNLYSLDAQDGTLKWSFQTQGIVRSRPAIAGELVYFASDDGNLYAVHTHSGAQIWRTDIGNSLPRNKREKLGLSTEPTGWDYKQSSPVVVDGYVYIGSLDGNVYALAADTGTIQWTFLTGQQVRATPTLFNNTLYIGSWDESVYALNAQTGQIIWKTPVGGEVQSTALVVDGLVYTASRKASIVALDAQTGQVKWEHDYSTNMWVESSPILMGNTIYIGSSGKQPVLGLNPGTGNIISAFFTKAFNWSTPFILNNMLYIGAISFKQDENKGGLIGLQLEGSKFSNASQEDWYFPVLERETAEGNWSGVVSSPVVYDGVVYFGGLDGKLYAVKTTN